MSFVDYGLNRMCVSCGPHYSFLVTIANKTAFPPLTGDNASFQPNLPIEGQEKMWLMVSKWLETCSSHKQCQNLISQSLIPKRLIYLCSDSQKLQLRVSEDIPSRSRYATLSHCWGTLIFETLKMDNLEQLKLEIPQKSLSKSFQDAITVTRKLGLEYIWIDSLCIVQDSVDDWQEQSALMGSIYSASSCNISATDANDGSEGLFLQRSSFSPLLVETTFNGLKGTFNVHQNYLWDRRIPNSVLCKRGWVYQERALSARNLHFCKDQVIWECCEMSRSEEFPSGFDRDSWASPDSEFKQRFNKIFRQGLVDDGEWRCLTLWSDFITQYSQTTLTYPTDRLIAMAGVARLIHHQRHDTLGRYVAGLWETRLPLQLMWSGDPVEEPYVAPSWSWARCRGPVQMNVPATNREDICNVKVLDFHTELASSNEFGQVTSGYLCLGAMLVAFKQRPGSPDFSYTQVMIGDSEKQKEKRFNLLVTWDNKFQDSESLFFLMPIISHIDEREPINRGAHIDTSKMSWTKGLVLEMSAESPSTFKRRGTFAMVGQLWSFKEGCQFLVKASEYFNAMAIAQSMDRVEEVDFNGSKVYQYSIKIL